MKFFKTLISLGSLIAAGTALAAPVLSGTGTTANGDRYEWSEITSGGACTGSTLGVRVTVATPTNGGGFCYSQIGNIQNADFLSVEAAADSFFDAPSAPFSGTFEAINEARSLTIAGYGAVTLNRGSNTAGTWSVDSAFASDYERVFIGFHFGNGRDNRATNPDSFVMEVTGLSGTWSLGGDGASLNGLSNYYVFGYGEGGGGGGNCAPGQCQNVPEPATGALAGAALLGLAFRRRMSGAVKV